MVGYRVSDPTTFMTTKTTREAKGSYFKFIAEGNKVFPDNMYGKIKTTFGKIKYE